MNIATNPYTLSELKRQAGFHRTMHRQHEEKHQAAQAEKLAKIAKLEEQIALAEFVQAEESK